MVEIALFPFSELKLFREMFTPSFLWCAAARNTKMIVLISLSLSLYQVCGLLSIFISQSASFGSRAPEGEERHSWELFWYKLDFSSLRFTTPLFWRHLHLGRRCHPGLGVLGTLPWADPTPALQRCLQGLGCNPGIGSALVLLWEVTVVQRLGKGKK